MSNTKTIQLTDATRIEWKVNQKTTTDQFRVFYLEEYIGDCLVSNHFYTNKIIKEIGTILMDSFCNDLMTQKEFITKTKLLKCVTEDLHQNCMQNEHISDLI